MNSLRVERPLRPPFASRHSRTWVALVAFTIASFGCAPRAPSRFVEQVTLVGDDGRAHDLSREVGESELTVFVFFAQDCPCVSAHEPRLKELWEKFGPRGARIFLVDAEVSASPERSAREARARGYPFPLLSDPEGRLARAFNVEYATHSVVVDRQGEVLYSGAIDSDKTMLHEGARPYLAEVLDDLLAGRSPRHARTEPMGCVLERASSF